MSGDGATLSFPLPSPTLASLTLIADRQREMQRVVVALLVAITALSVASAAPQSGLFYWCSFAESSTGNFAAIDTAFSSVLPRTTVIGLSYGISSPCHYPGGGNYASLVNSDQVAYAAPAAFTNGSNYPANTPTSLFAIAPTFCLVSHPPRGRK